MEGPRVLSAPTGPSRHPGPLRKHQVWNAEFSGERSSPRRNPEEVNKTGVLHGPLLTSKQTTRAHAGEPLLPRSSRKQAWQRGAGSLGPPGSGFIIFLYYPAPDLVMMIQFVSKALCQVSREYEEATFLAFKTLEPGYGEIFSN